MKSNYLNDLARSQGFDIGKQRKIELQAMRADLAAKTLLGEEVDRANKPDLVIAEINELMVVCENAERNTQYEAHKGLHKAKAEYFDKLANQLCERLGVSRDSVSRTVSVGDEMYVGIVLGTQPLIKTSEG